MSSNMTDKELDEALALEVMEWLFWDGFYYGKDGGTEQPYILWTPTTDLNQAFEVLEKYIDRKRNAVIHYNIDINYASIYEYGARDAIGESKGKNLARAICEAVLTAKRGKE